MWCERSSRLWLPSSGSATTQMRLRPSKCPQDSPVTQDSPVSQCSVTLLVSSGRPPGFLRPAGVRLSRPPTASRCEVLAAYVRVEPQQMTHSK